MKVKPFFLPVLSFAFRRKCELKRNTQNVMIELELNTHFVMIDLPGNTQNVMLKYPRSYIRINLNTQEVMINTQSVMIVASDQS